MAGRQEAIGSRLAPQRPLRDSLRSRLSGNLPLLISALAIVTTWEVVGRTADLTVLPPLSEIFAALWQFLVDGTIFNALGVSLLTLALGMGLSIVLGITIGALMGRYRVVEYALDVYVNAAMAAPMVAFVPVFILIFGIGYPTRVLTVILFAIFPIIVDTFAGIRNVDPSLVEMGRSFRATERQLFWRIRVPAAFPLLLAGVRLGTARGVKGLINGEVLVAVVGLGGLVDRFGTPFSMERLYALIFFLVALALVLVRLVEMLSRRIVRAPG
ncbi:MAG: ABC transporter permease [Candidatus Limnocylindria bacterium]